MNKIDIAAVEQTLEGHVAAMTAVTEKSKELGVQKTGREIGDRLGLLLSHYVKGHGEKEFHDEGLTVDGRLTLVTHFVNKGLSELRACCNGDANALPRPFAERWWHNMEITQEKGTGYSTEELQERQALAEKFGARKGQWSKKIRK